MKPEELTELDEKALDELALEKGRALSDQHRVFAERLVSGASQTKAAMDAGYTESNARKTASIIVRREDVRTYTDILREQLRRVAAASREWMVRQHLEAAKMAKEAGDWAGFKACMTEAGKLLDLYPATKHEAKHDHKHEHSGAVGVNTNYQPEEVLRELMEIRHNESRDKALH